MQCLNIVIVLIIGATGMCKWVVTLPATKADAQTTYTITATSQKHGSIKISDVLFGDVWVCSGQSNMQFTVPQVWVYLAVYNKCCIIFFIIFRFIMLQMRLPRQPIIPSFDCLQQHLRTLLLL